MLTQIIPVIAVALALCGIATGNALEKDIGEPFAISTKYGLSEVPIQIEDVDLQQGGLCLSETNAARAANGKGGLSSNAALETAARNHNQVMESQNCFSHQCPGEPGLGERVASAGYQWRGLGENIAKGFGSCTAVVNAWMNSPGHRGNILGNYQNLGCAVSGNLWTCVYGNPAR